jgi:hypothetical protein
MNFFAQNENSTQRSRCLFPSKLAPWLAEIEGWGGGGQRRRWGELEAIPAAEVENYDEQTTRQGASVVFGRPVEFNLKNKKKRRVNKDTVV